MWCGDAARAMRPAAGVDTDGGEEDPALQAGQPRHVRVGDPRPAGDGARVRAHGHAVRQLREPHPAERRALARRRPADARLLLAPPRSAPTSRPHR